MMLNGSTDIDKLEQKNTETRWRCKKIEGRSLAVLDISTWASLKPTLKILDCPLFEQPKIWEGTFMAIYLSSAVSAVSID